MNTFNNEHRLKILSPKEIQDLFDQPCFDDDERKIYFSLDEVELKTAKAHRTIDSQVTFVLDLGYYATR